MNLFGYDIHVALPSPRYFVWKIEKFVVTTLLVGSILSLILSMIWWLSDSLLLKLFFTVVYAVGFVTYALAFNGRAKSAIAELNQIVGQGSMIPDSVPEFEGDIVEDKNFAVLTGKINILVALVPGVLFLILLWFCAILVGGQLKVLSYYVWFSFYWGLAFQLSRLAESAANDDFTLSLRGALIKLFNVDTTSFQNR